jgi:DNA polymerase III epsilon subunit-like protein
MGGLIKYICLMEAVTKKLGRRISLDNACNINQVDISKRSVHGALIDTKLTAELLIAINTNSHNALTSVPKKNKHAETTKFAFPRAYKEFR